MFAHPTADTPSVPIPFPDLDVPWWIEPLGPEPEDSFAPGEAVDGPPPAQHDITEA